MDRIKSKIDDINETIPEINGIRADFTIMKNEIAKRINGRTEVPKKEGDEIIKDMLNKVDKLVAKINETVKLVKTTKNKTAKELYTEFITCIEYLENVGLMENGGFSFQETVAYQMLVDKDKFIQPDEKTKEEDNPYKYHIEFEYGIDYFFTSIALALSTLSEPAKVKKTYVNIGKYVSDNIDPIEVNVANYIDKLKKDYKADIQCLKKHTKDRIDFIVVLIKRKDEELSNIRKKAYEIASDEKVYKNTINELENVRKYLNLLISKLSYTQIG